jgi:IS30 family transposase
MASGQLNLSARYRIHAMCEVGNWLRMIAAELGRSLSTVSREFARNRDADSYIPEAAHSNSEQRRSRASQRPGVDPQRIVQIHALLAEALSPKQIAGRTGLASPACIYHHIYAELSASPFPSDARD